MELLDALLRGQPAAEERLEHAPRDEHAAFIFAHADGELNSAFSLVPARIIRKGEHRNHAASLAAARRQDQGASIVQTDNGRGARYVTRDSQLKVALGLLVVGAATIVGLLALALKLLPLHVIGISG